MAKGVLMSNESDHGQLRAKSVRISFSKKVKLDSTLPHSSPAQELDRSEKNSRDWIGTREVVFARIGGFPEEGVKAVKWIVDNVKSIKLNDNRANNSAHFGGALNGGVNEVSVRRTRQRRQPCFARLADGLDPETKETLDEVTDNVIDTAQQARVPIPEARLPYLGFVRSLTIKHLLCGILAGGVAATVSAPFELVRSRVIAGQGGQTAAAVITTAAKNEGIQSLMQGSLSFNIIKTAIERGLMFTTFEAVKSYEKRHPEKKLEDGKFVRQEKWLPLPRKIPIATTGGAAGGFLSTVMSYPFQVIMDRLFLQPEKYTSFQGTVVQILKNEGGIRELYRGINPALIAIVPNAAASFYAYETLKTNIYKKRLGRGRSKPVLEALQSLLIGGLAGAIATTITYPLEEARKQIVLSTLSKKAVHLSGQKVNAVYNNTWQALTGIVQKEGWHGLYRGLTVQTVQIIPVTAVTFMTYELAKRAFVASGEEDRDEVLDADDIK